MPQCTLRVCGTGTDATMTPTYFRKQAQSLYELARTTQDATERLVLVLNAMEFEARAVEAERGKLPPAPVRS